MSETRLMFFVLIAFCFVNCKANENNCTYTIVTSRVIKLGRPHQFGVTTACETQTSFLLKAWISSATLNSTKKIFKLKTGITKICSIQIPKTLGSEEHFFVLEGTGGLNFYENRSVTVGRKIFSLFIQTDKAVYKPRDRVLFRVLALNPDLKPSKLAVNVTITDPKNNRIYQSLNLPTKKGIASGSFPLSKSTNLGKWTITAKSKSESKNYRFEVKEYVLPKFKVELFASERFHVNVNNPANQKNLSVSVSAKYTYGQPVRGVALFTLTHNNYYQTNRNKLSISKTIKLEDGKADMEVACSDLLELIPCFYGEPSLEYQSFNVEVNVTEVVTGIVVSERTNVLSRSGRFHLETVTRGRIFKPGFPFKMTFLLRRVDGELPGPSDVQFSDGSPRNIPVVVNLGFGDQSASTLEQKYLTNLTQQGTSHLTIDTNVNIKSLRIEAAYYDEASNDTTRSYYYVDAFETRDGGQIQVELENNEDAFLPGKLTTFTVRSTRPITTFQYQIFSKNSLLLSHLVTGDNSTVHWFSVNTTFDLSLGLTPEAVVVAFYVDADGELIADTIVVPVVKCLFNEVQLSFSKNLTSPSNEVLVNINASRGSTVALLAVDQSVKLLKSGNDITEDKVVSELYSYGNQIRPRTQPEEFAGRSLGGEDTTTMLRYADVIIITNHYIHEVSSDYDYDAEDDSDSETEKTKSLKKQNHRSRSRKRLISADSVMSPMESSGAAMGVAQPRTEFPETWIWSEIDDINDENTSLTFKVPDTITSWVLSAFAISEEKGLGLGEPVEITVFKPMFVSLNLPYSVVRGEEFALVVSIFNYLETNIKVEVSLAQSRGFRTRKCDSLNLLESFESEISKHIEIERRDSESVHFWIVPTTVGRVPIEVKASGGGVEDVVIMELLVNPEGQPQSYSRSALLGSSVRNSSTVDFLVTLPPTDVLVPDSAIIEVSVIGNIFASTIENIQNLINLPAGCGEQNIITFAPNIYILNFLSITNELSKEKEDSLTDLLLAGFGQQLTFQRSDGSYSAFGDKDQEGSVWLSSFVLKSFRHSKSYLSFEPKMVTKTLKWILSHQNIDGSFSEPNGSKILHSKMQGGSSSGVSLTAYVLIAIHENKIYKNIVKNLDGSIRNATSYLERHYASHANDSYVLSIVTYSFHLVKSRHFQKAYQMLASRAIKEGESIHWKTQSTTPQESKAWKPFYEKPVTYDIEATSYALLTYSAKGGTDPLLIAKWLIMQRNEAGGFRSTQDTVIALEALSKFARVLSLESSEYDVGVHAESDVDNKKQGFTRISKDNSFLLQTIQLPEDSKVVKVSIEGKGYAVAQLKVKYNVHNASKHSLLDLSVSTVNTKGLLLLFLTLRWLGEEASGMVIVEVETPTGWQVEDEMRLFQELETKVQKIESKQSKIILYLNELTKSSLNFEITLENKFSIFGAKPALVKVYRYYEPDTIATAFYSASGKQTWLSACPECCS